MPERLRWGILGTGNIARQFADGVGSEPRSRIVAVGSRKLDTAREFAAAREIPREWGGGSLMDVGCYCINFSRLLAREEPLTMSAQARMHSMGVDEALVASMQFPSRILASFNCGMSVQADNTATLCGTEGYIEIPV